MPVPSVLAMVIPSIEKTSVVNASAMDRQRSASGVDDVRATHVHVAQVDARNHERGNLRRAAGRNRIQQLLVDHSLPLRALNIDNRCVTRDGDRFFDRAQLQLGVDRGRERSRELDAFATNGRESRQREHDGIRAATQLFDAELAGAVGHDRSCFFDERRTRSLDRDTWKHGA